MKRRLYALQQIHSLSYEYSSKKNDGKTTTQTCMWWIDSDSTENSFRKTGDAAGLIRGLARYIEYHFDGMLVVGLVRWEYARCFGIKRFAVLSFLFGSGLFVGAR